MKLTENCACHNMLADQAYCTHQVQW